MKRILTIRMYLAPINSSASLLIHVAKPLSQKTLISSNFYNIVTGDEAYIELQYQLSQSSWAVCCAKQVSPKITRCSDRVGPSLSNTVGRIIVPISKRFTHFQVSYYRNKEENKCEPCITTDLQILSLIEFRFIYRMPINFVLGA